MLYRGDSDGPREVESVQMIPHTLIPPPPVSSIAPFSLSLDRPSRGLYAQGLLEFWQWFWAKEWARDMRGGGVTLEYSGADFFTCLQPRPGW